MQCRTINNFIEKFLEQDKESKKLKADITSKMNNSLEKLSHIRIHANFVVSY